MAKIHTVEWTPAILPHPIIKTGDERRTGPASRAKTCRSALEFLDDSELLGGIVGSKADHHTRAVLADRGVRLRLPHAPADAGRRTRSTRRRPAGCWRSAPLDEIAGRRTPAIAERLTMPDLFYSFGTCHPGAVTLHNYPAAPAEPARETTASISIWRRSTSCATASAACRATTSSAGCCTRTR